jgi:hypothetical protein
MKGLMRLTMARILFVLLAGLALLLAACSSAVSTPTPASESLKISLTTNPDPLQSGNVELTVAVQDTQDQPIDDARVFIFANHRDMVGMGAEYDVVAQGDGQYKATVNLGMDGRWRFTVQVNQDSERVVVDFDLETN